MLPAAGRQSVPYGVAWTWQPPCSTCGYYVKEDYKETDPLRLMSVNEYSGGRCEADEGGGGGGKIKRRQDSGAAGRLEGPCAAVPLPTSLPSIVGIRRVITVIFVFYKEVGLEHL